MPMALGMKDISNLGYMHCTTAVSLEMSDEPVFCFDPHKVLTTICVREKEGNEAASPRGEQ